MGIDTKKHVVKKDDNLWNIIKAAGFPPKDWKKIYGAEYNRDFKKKRKDPNLILKGDVFFVPAYNKKDIQKQLKKYLDSLKAIQAGVVLIGSVKKDIANIEARKTSYQELKKKLLPKLTAKCKLKKKMLDSVYKPDPQDGASAGGGLFFAKLLSQQWKDYLKLERELLNLEKELRDPEFAKHGNPKLKAKTKKLTGIANILEARQKKLLTQAQKDIQVLAKMQKKPY